MVLSSHLPGTIPTTGKGGWYLDEAAHPYAQFAKAGYEITICSIAGGDATATVDPESVAGADAEAKEFWETKTDVLKVTKQLSEYKGSDFDAFMLVGGFGVMYDFFPNAEVGRVGQETWESNGIVGSVCHGPIGLASIKLADGTALVKGKTVAGFTNEEEVVVGLTEYYTKNDVEGESLSTVEDVLKKLGANYTKKDNWNCHVEVDGNLVSGQNPQSAGKVGEEIVNILSKR